MRGYTLIEILITMSILTLLFFGGYGAYREFTRRQTLDNFYKEFRVDLSLARERAVSGEKPTGCSGTLAGYAVGFSTESYTVSAVCSSNVLIKQTSIPSDLQMTGAPNFTYKVLGQGTNLLPQTTTITIRQISTGRVITAELTKEGILQR